MVLPVGRKHDELVSWVGRGETLAIDDLLDVNISNTKRLSEPRCYWAVSFPSDQVPLGEAFALTELNAFILSYLMECPRVINRPHPNFGWLTSDVIFNAVDRRFRAPEIHSIGFGEYEFSMERLSIARKWNVHAEYLDGRVLNQTVDYEAVSKLLGVSGVLRCRPTDDRGQIFILKMADKLHVLRADFEYRLAELADAIDCTSVDVDFCVFIFDVFDGAPYISYCDPRPPFFYFRRIEREVRSWVESYE